MTRTYKGIVCEKKDKYYIFLTNEGEFLQGTPLGTDPEIGEEVKFQLFKGTSMSRKWIKPSVLAPVLVAAVFLICVVTSFIPNPSPALAYVQLDGNNAVELGVNKKGEVVTLRSLNEKTPLLLDDWEGHPIDYVLAKAVTQISPTTEKIAVTTVYEKDKQSADIRKRIEVAVKEVQKQHTKKELIIKESTTKERKEANKHNTSIQKLKHTNKEKEENKTREHKSNNQETEDNKLPSPLKVPNDIPTKEKEKQEEKLIEKQLEQKEQDLEKQQKETEKQQEKIEKTKEKEAQKLEKVREKEAKQKEKEQHKNEKNKD